MMDRRNETKRKMLKMATLHEANKFCVKTMQD